jgi:hypothetical protein
MYPQVVQLETGRLQMERELRFARERRRIRAGLETAPGSTFAKSWRLRTLARSARWSRRAATSQS